MSSSAPKLHQCLLESACHLLPDLSAIFCLSFLLDLPSICCINYPHFLLKMCAFLSLILPQSLVSILDCARYFLIMFLLLWAAYIDCISYILLPLYCPNSSHGDEHSNHHWKVQWPRFSHLANEDKVSFDETQLVEPRQGNFFLINDPSSFGL